MERDKQRRASAAIAPGRLSHLERDGSAVAGNDELSDVKKRLSEALAVIEQREDPAVEVLAWASRDVDGSLTVP